MSWIVKDEPRQEIESFDNRMARLQDTVQSASDEQLQKWFDTDGGDLCQAARIELANRRNHVGSTNYSPSWLR